MSKNADIRFYINNQQVDYALETFDISIKADFSNDNIQPNISIDNVTIFGDGVTIINDWINAGKYYKGLPIKIEVFNDSSAYSLFDGYINLPKKYEVFSDKTVNVAIVKKNGLNNLNDKLASITWGMLIDKGIVTDSDYSEVNYVVEKSNNAFEIITLLIMVFIMTKELYESIVRIADNVNKLITSTVPAVGVGAVEMVGQIIYAALSLILSVLYAALILASIVKITIQLFDILIEPSRTHKCINYRHALEILSIHLGYTFETSISELDNYYYLPSNINVDIIDGIKGFISIPQGVKVGTPSTNDFGYVALDFVNIILKQFEAKIAIINDRLILRPKNDVFWQKQATYQMPDIFIENYETNAKDLKFSTLIKYETDIIADEYTLSNFKGTNYQILVNDSNVTQGKDDDFILHHETINISLALGTRKNELNALERTATTLANIIDDVTKALGRGTHFANKIKNRIGLLKIGTNNHTIPKCLYLSGGKLPTNHRDLTSAKYLWDNFINHRSFVANNKIQQSKVVRLKEVPFGMQDFLSTIENSYFLTHENKKAKIIDSKWNILKDTAEISYKENFIFAPNLTETYIEQA